MFLFVSSSKSELSSQENARRYGDLKLLLDIGGFKYTEAIGKYDGHIEPSIILDWSEANERAVITISREFDQDAYLVTDNKRYGYLIDKHGNYIDSLGKYQVSNERPIGIDYTEVNGKFMYFDKGI